MKPIIIKTDGTVIDYPPKNGKTFNGEELNSAVDGYLEAVYLSRDIVMMVNEEGKLKQLPYNAKATELAKGRLRENDFIVGDVLVAPREMFD